MKTKSIKFIALLTSIVLVMFMLTGCKLSGRKVQHYFYDGFEYIIVNERNPNTKEEREFIAIIDYKGDREVIDIPREIDGKPVRCIGYRNYEIISPIMRENQYSFSNTNIKRIYIYDNIEFIFGAAFMGIVGYRGEIIRNSDLDIMDCIADIDIILSPNIDFYANCYFYRSIYDITPFVPENIHFANVEFMNNYSDEVNQGYYSLDNVNEGETIHKPLTPQRSGYEFTGWYTESECINEWDFNVSPEIEEDTEFRLYAGWREV